MVRIIALLLLLLIIAGLSLVGYAIWGDLDPVPGEIREPVRMELK